MKKLLLIILVVMPFSASSVSTARGDIYEFGPQREDLYDLGHWRYYIWGIDWDVPETEMIVGASLSLDHIRNWNSGPNDLWIQLLDFAEPGVKVGFDNQWRAVNFFADGEGIEIRHFRNLTTTPVDLDYSLDSEEIGFLSTYATDGRFGLGFDPDCHYWNDGVTLQVETTIYPNPIPPAVFLFPTGLFGLAVLHGIRRRNQNNR
jgi:hypothetical protein